MEKNKPEQKTPEAEKGLLDDVSSVDEAKEYLKAVCFYKFKDKTYESYIDNKLAGDFAIEIANVIIAERNKNKARNFI